MHIVSRNTLATLALVSGVATSSCAPSPKHSYCPSRANVGDFLRSIFAALTPQAPNDVSIRIRNINLETRLPDRELAQLLAPMLARRAAASLLLPSIDGVVDALKRMARVFRCVQFDCHTDRVPLQSCFNAAYTPEQLNLCVRNLWHLIDEYPDIISSDWLKLPRKVLFHSILMGARWHKARHGSLPPNWHVKYADQQEDRLLDETEQSENWPNDGLELFVKLLARITHNKAYARMKSHALTQQLAPLLAQQAADSLLLTDAAGVAAAFTEISRVFQCVQFDRLTDRVPLRSCLDAAYTPEQRSLCAKNLWHLLDEYPDTVSSDWLKLPRKALVRTLVLGAKLYKARHGYLPSNWHFKYADQQKDRLLGEIKPSENWTSEELELFVKLLARIPPNSEIDRENLRHVIGIRLCDLVAEAMKDGATKPKNVILSLRKYLLNEPTVKTRNFFDDVRGVHYSPPKSMHECIIHPPGIYDIFHGLTHSVHISHDDKVKLDEELNSDLSWSDWLSYYSWSEYDAEGAAQFADLLYKIDDSDRISAVIKSALFGWSPPRNVFNNNNPTHTASTPDWLWWQLRFSAIEHFAVNYNMDTALEAVRLLGEKRAIPDWVNLELLKRRLRNKVKMAKMDRK